MRVKHVTLPAAAEIRKDPRSNTPKVRVIDEPELHPGDLVEPAPEPHATEEHKRP